MQKNNRVSVVVLHYGHGSELFRCLDSLAKVKRKFELTEVILVDNNEEKTDKNKILKNYPWVKYIPAPKNLGWCEGHNLGFKLAKGEYIFSLDSDVLIDIKSFRNIYEVIKNNQKIGIVSPRVRNRSGEPFLGATLELTPLRGMFYLSFIKKLFPGNSVVKNHLISDWDRKTSRYVEVIQLGAFIMRKDAYEDINGFDKDIFLYFHEDDVSKRLREKGWKLFFDSKSEAIHLESKWTPKNTAKIRKIWAKCRFRYFRKHYGVLSAILVEFFASISKETVLITSIVFLATFLRFYRFLPNFIFNGEMGTDYMNIWNIIHGSRTFLIGPRTSHEWLFISPIAYWIYIPLLLIWNYNPIAINVFWGIVGSLSVLVSYLVVKKMFNKNIALISSFLIATSPSWIMQTRNSRYNLVAAILFLPYLLYLNNSINDRGKSLFKLGLVLGFSMSFFPSPVLLIPAAIVSFIFYKVRPRLKYILYSLLGFLIPNIAFLIYEISNKFDITIKLLSWVPYRVLGFFGLYNKNTVDSTILSQNLLSIYKFFTDSFVGYSGILSTILFILIIGGLVFLLKKYFKSKKKEMPFFLLILSLVVSYLGLFVHGNPPQHYYLVIYPIPMILAAYIIDKLFKKKFLLIGTTLVLGIIGILGLIKTNWFFLDRKLADRKINFVPYSTQLKITDAIISNSGSSNFSLARIGVDDQFENDFANNYIYLLTVRGAKVDDNVENRYIIVEGIDNYDRLLGSLIFSESNVYVFRTK